MAIQQINKSFVKYIFIFIGIAILLGVGGYFFVYLPSKEKQKEATDIIDEAEELVSDMNYVEAVDKYKLAEEIDGGNADIYLGLADIYLLKNREDSAKEVLNLGVNKARKSSALYEKLGEIYLSDANYSKAIYFLEKSLSRDKDNDNAKILLAQSYVGAGDFEKAKEVLDVSDENKTLFAKSKLLEAMLMRDDVDNAKDIIEKIDLDGVENKIADQVDFLEGVLNDISELDDDIRSDVYISVMLSRAALYCDYPDIVIGFLSEYLNEYSLYWELNLYLGNAYLEKGNYESALKYLLEAYVLEGDSAIGSRLLARAYFGNNNDSEMIKYYEKAISLSNGDERISTRLEYFHVLLRKEQYARAEEQLDYLLISDDLDTEELLFEWGSCLLNRELYSQLEDLLSKIDVDDLSDNLKAEHYYLQSGVYYGDARWSEAESLILEAIDINDFEAKYHLLYGKILYQTSEDFQALAELERSVELDLEGDVSIEAQKFLDRI